eukprot:m.277630 g.277630  ORF g.277630 m.277630 type:complete len:403 (+) comp11101_c0_seq63:2751-3959(+)
MSKAISKSVKKRQQSLKAQRDYAVLEQRGEIVSPSEYAALVSRAEPRFRDIVAAAAAMGAKGVPREDYAFALGYVLAVHYAHDPPHRIALLAGITVGDRFKTAQAFGAQAVVVGATTLEVWAEWARTVRAGLQRGDTALFTGAPAKSLSHTLTRFSHHFGKHITSTSIRASVHTHAAQHLSPAEVAAIARTDTHSMSTAAAFYDRRGAEQAAAAAAAATSKLRALGDGSGGIGGSVRRSWEGGCTVIGSRSVWRSPHEARPLRPPQPPQSHRRPAQSPAKQGSLHVRMSAARVTDSADDDDDDDDSTASSSSSEGSADEANAATTDRRRRAPWDDNELHALHTVLAGGANADNTLAGWRALLRSDAAFAAALQPAHRDAKKLQDTARALLAGKYAARGFPPP